MRGKREADKMDFNFTRDEVFTLLVDTFVLFAVFFAMLLGCALFQ